MQVQSVITTELYGKVTSSAGPATAFKGTFQPLRGEEMQSLPEGRRAGANFKVYSDLDFDTVTSNENPDQIVLNGSVYEIIRREPWQNTLINHYKYIVQELKSK